MRNDILRRLSRRTFIRNSVIASSGAILAGSLVTACNDKNFKPEGPHGFFEGVASFDPSQTSIILWTRYTPAQNEPKSPEIILDVATSPEFSDGTIVASSQVLADESRDRTIYVDLDKLKPNTKYYYRFRNELTKAESPIGETKTLPEKSDVEAISMAVISCANFQAGLFNVYGAIAESDVEVVVHLGDYIYEYGEGGYGTNANTMKLGRAHQPAGEIISLDDYRQRYRQYRGDEQLQEAHRLKPFICVWDDHEISNDTYMEGAQNHQPEEGSFEQRKSNALQAWHEYLPARVDDNAKIYRKFDFGGILELFMLDTRIVGRDKQLEYSDYFGSDGFNSDKFVSDWMNPERSLLGQTQREWLMNAISGSTASWQVLGSQVLMAKYQIPSELLAITAQLAQSPSEELFNKYKTLLGELASIKARLLAGDPKVSDAEKARLQNILPYNLDAWDGYPAEREKIFVAAKDKKLIAIAGDTHNAWHSQLTDQSGQKVGVEFATASVSSPGLESILDDDPKALEAFTKANQLLIDDLEYLNPSERGYLYLEFQNAEAHAEWRFVKTITERDTNTHIGHTAKEA